MGIKLERKKPRSLLLSIIYKLFRKFPLLSSKKRFQFFLDLEWIFDRLSHEASFEFYSVPDHPVRKHSLDFISSKVSNEDTVVDLGSNLGDISFELSKFAKSVLGVDYNQEAILTAQKRYTKDNLSFVHCDARTYFEQNNLNFDVLILSHILEHIDEPEAFLLDVKDYFRYVFIEVPDFDKSYLNHYRKDQDSTLIYSDPDHVSEFDRNEIVTIIKNCGLTIETSDYKFGVQKYWCSNTK